MKRGFAFSARRRARSVPADRRLGPNHDQGIAPIEEQGKHRQRHPRRGVNTPRLGAALLIQHNEAAQVGE